MKREILHAVMSFDKATLTLGNAGVSGSMLPDDPESVKRALEGFSWFGSSADTSKYFGDVNNKNIVPKPEDFIRVPFRLISAAIVGAGTWKATDFSDAILLKGSLGKLDKKPIFFDHEQDIMNWVGIVTEPTWSEERVQDGMKIPAGIDATLAIDAKTNPKLARGVLIGAVMSNSVTVIFDWQKSHPELDDDEFYDKIGTVVNDKMVCRKVTKIYDYYETSLCWLGADPYAKMYDENGNLKNVDKTSVFEDEPDTVQTAYKKEGRYNAVFGYNKQVFMSLSKRFSNTNNVEKMNEELLKLICTALGLSVDTKLDAEFLKAELDKRVILLKSDKDSFDACKAVSDTVTEMAKTCLGKDCDNVSEFLKNHKFVDSSVDVESLTASQQLLSSVKTELACEKDEEIVSTITCMKSQAEYGRKALSEKREETKRLYSLSVENKTDEAVINMIEKASIEELNGLLKMYTKGVQESFKGVCKKCGSTEFTFRSSHQEPEGSFNQAENANSMSFEDIYNAESQPKFNIAK